MSGKIKVTLIKSVCGTSQSQRATLLALGLHKTNSSAAVPDRPEIQGMIRKVQHLVKTETVQS
jgi:large subunit ribosomal protein L30